jgi:hypothetical protein
MVFRNTLHILDFSIVKYIITTLSFRSRLCFLPHVRTCLVNPLERDAPSYWARESDLNFFENLAD